MDKMAWKEGDLNHLPQEMVKQQRFCVWRSVPAKSGSGKPRKIPYTSSGGGLLNRAVCNFPEGNFWTFDRVKIFLLRQRPKKAEDTFFPGFYLKGSNLSVIDIDNYHPNSGLLGLVMKFYHKGCYIEASPSGHGFHIFYSGSLNWTDGRKKSSTGLDTGQVKKTSCEVYGPDDIRFITVTGQKLHLPYISDIEPLPRAEELIEELTELQNIFFSSHHKQKHNSNIDKSSTLNKSSAEYFNDLEEINSKSAWILSKIKDSVCHFLFLQFVNCLKFDKHNSISETDMAFAGFISAYIPDEWLYSEKIDVMVKFFHSYRPQRNKTRDRLDYVRRTAQKALQSESSVKSRSGEKSKTAPDQKHPQSIKRASIFKICNIMQIFHLGRSYENFKYIENKNKDNSLEATCPESLTPTDFKYFMQLLFQYKESKLFTDQNTPQKNGYYKINIKKLGEELGAGISGGKHYRLFFNSLDKLSKVHLKWNKLINSDKQLYCTHSESLLSYRASYETRLSKDNRSYKRLEVRMHSAISEILSSAEYNYSLLNKESYNKLSSTELQLLYFYFCQKTLPGKNFTTFTLKDLLGLWPVSDDRRIIFNRMKKLIDLIEDFVSKQAELKDLYIQPIYENGKLTMVKVKKNRLSPVLNDN